MTCADSDMTEQLDNVIAHIYNQTVKLEQTFLCVTDKIVTVVLSFIKKIGP